MRTVRQGTAWLWIAIVCVAWTGVSADEPASAVGPLMKLFQSGRLPTERQATVVEMICNRGNENDLRVVFEKVLQPDGFDPDLRRNAMRWLTDAAVTRKVKPAGDLGALEQLVAAEGAAKDPGMQQAAIRLASTWKDAKIAPALQRLAADPKVTPELRRVAIDGLIAIGDPASRTTLEALSGAKHSLSIRMQAVSGLTGFDLKFAAAAAAQAFVDAKPQDDPARLLEAFLDRKHGADELAAAIAKQPPAVDVAKRALRHMYSVGRSDASLSDALSKAAGIAADAPPPTPAEVAQIAADVIAKGNPVRGEAVFRRKDLNCMKCHSVSRAGGQVGPELSALGGSSPVDYVLNSILNPNLAVKEQFATRVFELSTGRVLTGIVSDRDEVRVNIRDANGQRVTIPTADIDEEAEGQSLMPQGLTKFLTREELLDLAKFVSELGKPGPYAVQQAKTIQRWRTLRNPPAELTSDVPHLEHLRQFVFGSVPEDWDPAYARVAGTLPLDDLRSEGQPNVLILQGEVQVNADGRVAVHVACTETVQAWFDSAAFESKSPYEFMASPGLHKLTLRVELSDRPSPELRVEFKIPNDSTASLEVIGGA